MSMHGEMLPAMIVGAAYVVVFTIAEVWRRMGSPAPETTRKFVHFASGAICLSFSYVFASHWTVLALTVTFVAVMVVTDVTGTLRSVHGVSRTSRGGIYYPVAVYLTYLIAAVEEKPSYYLIAILVLAVSDSLAALVGGRYGFKLYKVEDEHKSLEGSIIFFTATFLIVHLGLLLLTGTARPNSVLLAVYIALLVTAFESISLGGADNLFIPVGTIAVLQQAAHRTVPELALRIGSVMALFALVFWVARFTRKLGLSAIIGIALTGYGAWMLAGYQWVFPILIGVALFSWLDMFLEDRRLLAGEIRIRPVFFVLVVSFVWVLAAGFLERYAHTFFVPYAVNLAGNLGILWHRRSRKGDYRAQMPLPVWLRHANLPLRALLLTLAFIPLTVATTEQLSMWFSLLSGWIGIVLIESVYWFVESRKRGAWEDLRFIKFTTLVSKVCTFAVWFANIFFYTDLNPGALRALLTNYGM